MIERFFEYLINKIYWEFRKEKDLPFNAFSPEPVIRFGGFELEEPYWSEPKKRVEVRRGWHAREPLLKMGEISVYTRTIYLNKLFLHKQMGLQVFFEKKEEFIERFNAESLVEVICHELAHAILTDIDPESQEVNGGHGEKHNEYTEQLRKLVISFPEHQELKRFWQ